VRRAEVFNLKRRTVYKISRKKGSPLSKGIPSFAIARKQEIAKTQVSFLSQKPGHKIRKEKIVTLGNLSLKIIQTNFEVQDKN